MAREPKLDSDNASESEQTTVTDENELAKTEPDAEHAAESAAAEKPQESEIVTPDTVKKSNAVTQKLKNIVGAYWVKKRWTLPATFLGLVLVLLAVPFTRFELLGLVLSKPVTVTVLDANTSRPVSGASVALDGQTMSTNASGKAVKTAHLGSIDIAVTKQYYKSAGQSSTVTFSAAHNAFTVRLVATGRRVPIKVINKITGKGVSGVDVNVLGTQTKTDSKGMADVVLPATSSTLKMTLTATGYNTLVGEVKVTDQVLVANTFTLVPSGKLYFLSNQSGKIDVVKTNLDGTQRETVLAGTGSEDPQNTSLLASKDWKYLALLARKTGDVQSISIIDTTQQDKITSIDDTAGNKSAGFNLLGWAGGNFVYYVNRNASYSSDWQPKQFAIKAYDAQSQKLNQIYESSSVGDSNNNAHENIPWVNLLGDKLVWFSAWSGTHQYYSNDFAELSGKQSQIYEYDFAANTKKSVKTYSSETTIPNGGYSSYYSPVVSYSAVAYAPNGLYLTLNKYGGDTQYDEYDAGKVTEDSSDSAAYFKNSGQEYKTYLASPSGKQTFWSEGRDGKNALFIGDPNGKNPKQIASLSEYATYGWFSDDYLLVSKKSSELYILPVAGGDPQKITDYYKPSITYRGYGGGYGGL